MMWIGIGVIWLLMKLALKIILWLPYVLIGFIHALLKHK